MTNKELKLEVEKTYRSETGLKFIVVADCRKFFNCDSFPFIAYFYDKFLCFSEKGASREGNFQLIEECREPYKHTTTKYFVYDAGIKPNPCCFLDDIVKKFTVSGFFSSFEEAGDYLNNFGCSYPPYKIGKVEFEATVYEDQQHD